MNNNDWEGVKERTDEYDKENTWEHLDKFDNSNECESEEIKYNQERNTNE
jgi:hypothetical protein